MAFIATGGESRGEESRPPGQEPDHMGLRGPVRTVAQGREGPGGSRLGSSGTFPRPHSHMEMEAPCEVMKPC